MKNTKRLVIHLNIWYLKPHKHTDTDIFHETFYRWLCFTVIDGARDF